MNNFAISSGGLGEALERSASSLAAANNSLHESAAMITAANEVTQNPEKVGNAMKTISMRIRGAKTEMEEMGEDTTGMVESTAKLRAEIQALSGVDIMASATEFKSTYQIMDELSRKWEDLSDISQATIIELMAGKHQGNVFASLMENFDTARKALETSLGSEGSALEEHAKYAESLEFRLNSLKASWQAFAQAFMDSDTLKVGIDALSGLVNVLEKLIDNFGLLGTLGLGVAGKNIFSYFKGAKEAKKTIADVANGIEHLTEVVQGGTSAANDAAEANKENIASELAEAEANKASAAAEMTETQANVTSVATEATEAEANATSTASELAEAEANATSTASELAEETQNITNAATEATETMTNLSGATVTAATSATKAAGGFKSFFGTLGGKVAIAAIAITVISGIINAIKKAREEASELRQETIKASDEFLDSSNTFEQAYAKYSGKTNLTVEEEAELESAIKSTVDALDDKSSALQNVVNSSGDYVTSLEQIAKAELEATKNAAEAKKKAAEEEFENITVGKVFGGLGAGTVMLSSAGDEANAIAKEIFGNSYMRATKGAGVYKSSISLEDAKDAQSVIDYYYKLIEYRDRLSEEKVDTVAYENVQKEIDKLSELIANYTDGVYEAAKAQYKLSNGIPKTTNAYLEMRQAILTNDEIASMPLSQRVAFANDLESQYNQMFDLDTAYAQARKFVGLIKGYGDGTKDGTNEIGTVETFLNMRTAVNNNECTVGEYLSQFDEINKMTENWSDEEKELLNTSFAIDTDTIKQQYKDTTDYLKRFMRKRNGGESVSDYAHYKIDAKKDIENFLNSLTAEELAAVIDIRTEIDWKNTSAEDIRKQIEDRVKLNEALNYTIAIDVETESVEALNAALSESVSATGLSSESIAALKGRYADLESEGYNLSTMFEETSNGIHLNRREVKKLEKAYANDKLSETNKQLGVLKDRYDELAKEIKECDDANDRADLYKEQKDIVDKINDLSTLAAQYKGLTSAYNEWLSVEESGSERDMYENMLEGFENIDDEISRGWIDDGTIEFLELLTGRTDLATLSAKQLKEVYKGLDDNIKNTTHSIRDFFTVDEDGNSTSQGVYNFLDAIGQLEEEEFGGKDVVKRNKNGKIIGFDIELAGGEKAIADALGISEELVQIMLRAADDAGFVVNLEGAYTQLADLKTEAELARDTLISLQEKGLKKLQGVDINFNLDAEGKDLVTEHEKAVELLDKFKKDGKIDLKMKGAQEALDIAEYLTIKLDDLTEPRYMQIDVTTVDEELQDPIEKMQEFGDLVREKHLVSLTGNTEDLKETEAEMKKVAEELEGLDPEIKAKVGIDDGWSAEEIADKLEKGEIEIPADVKIDVQMSDDLKDMRLMMMNQLGLVSDNEVKLKVGFDIDESIINELTEEEQEVVVKYIAENKEEFEKYTEEEKETVVKLIADGVDLDKYEAEDKEAIVNYIANGEEADGWTPEAKDAFVKYLVDGGEPDKFDPENKDSWVVYDTDTTKPDSYNADKTGTVTFQKDSSNIDNWKPTVTGVAKFVLSMVIPQAVRNALAAVGISIANGTANVDGTAFVGGTATKLKLINKSGKALRQGDWGVRKSETALTGELGQELVVYGNRFWTVGDTGAEFADIPKGAIVFNHRQTEEIFKYGKVTSDGGRGRIYANGTAFARGTAYAGLSGGGIEPESDKSGETFDWLEVLLSRLERTINNLDQAVNNAYDSWGNRNNNLGLEIDKNDELIHELGNASAAYLQAANAVSLDDNIKALIRNGALIPEGAGINKETAEKIQEYQKLYEKYLDTEDGFAKALVTKSELYAQYFNNVQSQYDGILQGYEHTESMLNEYISQVEAKGHIVSKNYYQALIDNEKNNIDELQKEQSDLIAKRDEAVASGAIVKGSQAWYDMCAEIDGVTQAIESGTTALIEYDNAMRDIDWQVFDLIQERISDVAEEANFLIDLMSYDKLFDDSGKLTEQGTSTIGLHAQNVNTYMYQADDYGAKVAEIDRKIASGEYDPYDDNVIAKRKKYLEAQRENILAAEDEKQAIKSLLEDAYSQELDYLQEKIDKTNEAIDSQKD